MATATEPWLETLPLHPIFSDSPSSHLPLKTTSPPRRQNIHALPEFSDEEDDDEDEDDVKGEGKDARPQRKDRLVVRAGTELIVAYGKEIRLTSLWEARQKHDVGKTHSEERDHYWVLRNSALTFQIHQIVLNPTERFLAVIGEKEAAVMSLPPVGSLLRDRHRDIKCQGVTICKAIYNGESSTRIVKALWHPLGNGGTSLFILTDDCILRDFETSRSALQPSQTFSLHPSQPITSPSDFKSANALPRPAKSRFSSADPDASQAVSFAFGKGEADWGPLTVWSLMKNGDVWASCPVLPQLAWIPENYIDALNLYVGGKAQQYKVQNNIPQTPAAGTTPLPGPSSTLGRSIDPVAKNLHLQQKYARSFSLQVDRSRRADAGSSTSSSGEPSEVYNYRSHAVHAQQYKERVKRQGPFLLQPAPVELPLTEEAGEGVEEVACDIAVLGDERGRVEKGGKGIGLNVLAVAWLQGRVDICLEVQKVEAEWDVEPVKTPSNGDEDDSPLPSLVMHHSIDLQLLDALDASSASFRYLIPNPPTFHSDPLDNSSFYVHHALGVHWISVKPWVGDLAKVLEGSEGDEGKKRLEKYWAEKKGSSECGWVIDTWEGQEDSTYVLPVTGTAILADLDLDYALFALTSEKDLAIMQLNEDLVVHDDEPASPLLEAMDLVVPPTHKDEKPPVSFLNDPYDVKLEDFDKVIGGRGERLQLSGKQALKPLEQITPDDLATMGNISKAYSEATLKLMQTSLKVEQRVDSQVQEISLQLNKLHGIMDRMAKLDHAYDASDRKYHLSDAPKTLQERFAKFREVQEGMVGRLEKAQKTIMDKMQPELSEQEQRWKLEMERVETVKTALVGESAALKVTVDKTVKEALARNQRDSSYAAENPRMIHQDQVNSLIAEVKKEDNDVNGMFSAIKSIRNKLHDLDMDSA